MSQNRGGGDQASAALAAAAAEEEQARRIAALVEAVRSDLERLKGASLAIAIPEVEEVSKRIREQLARPEVPRELVAEIGPRIKPLELHAYMKATDDALRRALAHAKDDRRGDRGRELMDARTFLRRAAALGAKQEFVETAERLIEDAMLTGGVRNYQPTRAKPGDQAPRPMVDRARNEQRQARRYTQPVLSVRIGEALYRTIDWSMGGLLVDGYSGALDAAMEAPVFCGLSNRVTVAATIQVVRHNQERATLAVRFVQPSPELIDFLRRLIVQRGARGV